VDHHPPVVLLCAAGVAVGGLAVGFRAVTAQPVDLVLFSGETALPQIVAETSAGVLALLVLVKGAAETIPIAVIASVIGWLVATALKQRETRHQPSRAPAS